MRKIDRLKKEVKEAAKFRGHKMGKFRTWKYSKIAMSVCNTCNRCVVVDLKPLPNGIEIGGEAVALNCENPDA